MIFSRKKFFFSKFVKYAKITKNSRKNNEISLGKVWTSIQKDFFEDLGRSFGKSLKSLKIFEDLWRSFQRSLKISEDLYKDLWRSLKIFEDLERSRKISKYLPEDIFIVFEKTFSILSSTRSDPGKIIFKISIFNENFRKISKDL